MTYRPVEVLLVEDSPGDVWLTKEALRQGSTRKNISVVNNGEQGIDFLRRRGAYSNAPRPDLVLLDLNLPRRDGIEVLREVKTDPDLRTITVVVLTTSEAPVDINAAYDLNANCYVVKPVDLEQFTAAIHGIEEFWMRLASLPTLDPHGSKETDRKKDEKPGLPNGDHSEAAGCCTSAARRFRPRPLRVRRAERVRMRVCAR